MAQVDPDQLAALRRLKAAFGDVEVLEVIDDGHVSVPPTAQGGLFDEEASEDELGPDEFPGAG